MRWIVLIYVIGSHSLSMGQCPVSDFLVNGTSSSIEACPTQVLDFVNQSFDAVNYEWDFCAGDLDETPSGNLVSTLTTIQSYDAIKIVKESDAQYYGFIVKQSAGRLFRLNFGSDLLSTPPSPDDLGALGLGGSSDIEFINDNGTWYALVASGSNLILLKFTAGLGGSSASISSLNLGNFGGAINNVRGLAVVKNGPDYFALATSATLNTLTSIKFEGSMEGVTSSVSVAVPGSSQLLAINAYKECDNWFAIMTSVGNNRLIKANLGLDLTSTTAFQFATQSGVTIQSYGMDLLVEDSQYYVFLATIGNPSTFYQLDFGSSIWNNDPVVYNHGSLSGLAVCIAIDFLLEDSNVIGFIGNRSNFQLHRITYPNICYANIPISTEGEPVNVNYSQTGIFSIELKAYDGDGNFDATSKEITVSSALDVDFDSDKTCTGENVLFFDMTQPGLHTVETWSWDFDGLDSSSIQNPSFQFSVDGLYSVTLQIQDNRGCVSAITKNVKIYSDTDITVDFTYDAIICTNGNEILNDASTYIEDQITDWMWDFNSGESTATGQSIEHVFLNNGINEIELTVTGISGCDFSVVKQANIIEGPFVDFEFSGNCQEAPVMLTNNSSPSVDSFSWTFGDGQVSTQKDPEVIYASTGEYEVTLTELGSTGCNNTISKSITIYSTPQTDFSVALPPFSCSGSATQFYDATPSPTDSNITSWLWDFDDAGSISSVQDPQHIYISAGDYDVSLTATTNYGCSATVQKTATITASPIADFSYSPPCRNVAVNFTDESVGTIQSWFWQIEGTAYTTASPVHTFLSSGDKNVILTVTATNGCVASLNDTVVVPGILIPDFVVEKNCINQQTIFTDLTNDVADPVSNHNWSFGIIGSSSGDPALFTFTNTGNYNTTLTVTTQTGCAYGLTKNIVVFSAPQASFSATPEIGEAPLIVQFSNSSTGATSLLWEFNDAAMSTSTDMAPQFTFQDLGQYAVELTAFNELNCTGKESRTISVVIPYLDVELTSLELLSSQNAVTPSVTIHNKGNVPVQNLPLLFDVSGNSSVRETLSIVIQPNSTYQHVAGFELPLQGNLVYVCAEVDIADVTDSDNRICSSIETPFLVLPPFPNPVLGKEDIVLAWTSTEENHVEIILLNSMGQSVFAGSVTSLLGYNSIQIATQSLSPGVYFLWVSSGFSTHVMRVVVAE